MKLHQLVELLDADTPVCIQDSHGITQYEDAEELAQDWAFYEAIRNREISAVWYSRTLYKSVVIHII